MKELKTYLFEAVSSGRHIRGREFPEDPDIEAMASFIEYKGFEEFDERKNHYTIRGYADRTGKDLYTLNIYSDGSCKLNIYQHGDDVDFRIYVTPGHRDDKFHSWYERMDSGSRLTEYDTFDEIRRVIVSHYKW